MVKRTWLILAMLAAVVTGCGSQGPANNPPAAGADRAPDFTVTTFTGEDFTLSEQKGKPVVLNFWESW
jgi:cytochrome oxidase Cu insertion factor (SCO1/SenC/PrrC family)